MVVLTLTVYQPVNETPYLALYAGVGKEHVGMVVERIAVPHHLVGADALVKKVAVGREHPPVPDFLNANLVLYQLQFFFRHVEARLARLVNHRQAVLVLHDVGLPTLLVLGIDRRLLLQLAVARAGIEAVVAP